MNYYHIFPLGFCGAPPSHDPWNQSQSDSDADRLDLVTEDLHRIAGLGFTGLYLGPIFLSGSHGYDTADYFQVDPRLGSAESVRRLVSRAHELGIAVVLDGVFNHVGRDFWAFRDLREHKQNSRYVSWFQNVRFDADNRYGDGFVYDGWEGVEELVLLNHDDPDVQEHLQSAAVHWINAFGIDGIRLDVAYSLPLWFLEQLNVRVRSESSSCWLLGEVIHGDYPSFVAPVRLDSITNYECYKGLWSSFNDRNFFEIAHSLTRLFARDGLLQEALSRGVLPYNFADNHDVDRIASTLAERAHIFPLLTLLYGIPGVPSVYYGSEYGIAGRKADGDAALRPDRETVAGTAVASEHASRVAAFVKTLNAARNAAPALAGGSYEQLFLDNTALAFGREGEHERVLVAANADSDPREIAVPDDWAGRYRSLLDGGEFTLSSETLLRLDGFGSQLAVNLD